MATPDNTTPAEPGAEAPRRRLRVGLPKGKKSFWSMELGKKSGGDDEFVDHPPFVPALPRVNLLPPAVSESFGIRRARRYLVAAVLVVALAAGSVWYLQGNQIAEAQALLAQGQADNAALQGRLNAIAPVTEMYNQITGQQELVRTTMAAQPQAALVITRLQESAIAAGQRGEDITFTNLSIDYRALPLPGGEVNTCPNPDPFATAITIGCLSFTATAGSRDEVSALLNLLAADSMFVGPYVTTSTITESVDGGASLVSFSGSAGISVEALETPLTQEQIDLLLAPPGPAASGQPVAPAVGG